MKKVHSIIFAALSLISTSAFPSESATSIVNEYRDATVRFSELVHRSETDKDEAILAGTQADELVSSLSNKDYFLSQSTRSLLDVVALSEICRLNSKAVSDLSLYNIRSELPKDLNDQQAVTKFNLLVVKNTKAFSKQLSRLQTFQIKCLGDNIEPIEKFVETNKSQLNAAQLGGLQQMQKGLIQTFLGVITINRTPDPEYQDYQLALLKTLTNSIENYTSAFSKDTRQNLIKFVTAAEKNNSPEAINYLEKINLALSSSTCSTLCKL